LRKPVVDPGTVLRPAWAERGAAAGGDTADLSPAAAAGAEAIEAAGGEDDATAAAGVADGDGGGAGTTEAA
jgi:hypothetical protein